MRRPFGGAVLGAAPLCIAMDSHALTRAATLQARRVAAAVTPWPEVKTRNLRNPYSTQLHALTRAGTSQASKVAAAVTPWRETKTLQIGCHLHA